MQEEFWSTKVYLSMPGFAATALAQVTGGPIHKLTIMEYDAI